MAALAINLSVGEAYAFSVFNLPLITPISVLIRGVPDRAEPRAGGDDPVGASTTNLAM